MTTGTLITLVVAVLGSSGLAGTLQWWSSRRGAQINAESKIVEMTIAHAEAVHKDMARLREQIESRDAQITALKLEVADLEKRLGKAEKASDKLERKLKDLE